jgi:hypothetical protein
LLEWKKKSVDDFRITFMECRGQPIGQKKVTAEKFQILICIQIVFFSLRRGVISHPIEFFGCRIE